MTTRLVMSFAWMVLLAAISSSTDSSLLNETGIEEFDVDKFRQSEESSNQDLNQTQIGSLSVKEYLEILRLPKVNGNHVMHHTIWKSKKNTRRPIPKPKSKPIQNYKDLKIAAFNIEQFGKKKLENAAVMQIIIKIINRYDIILIQEVMGNITYNLSMQLNPGNSKYNYTFLESNELGTSSHKERYLFLIRIGIGITIEDAYQFENTAETSFERPPSSIRLNYAGIPFVLTAIHTKPNKTAVRREIYQLLKTVYPDLVQRMNTSNILIMGDLNAGEGYLSSRNLTWLKNFKPLYWPLSDVEYTTVCSDNAHDRFIMTPDLGAKMVNGSAKVFKFDEDTTDPVYRSVTACRVSDHYPIELKLKF